MLSGPLGPLKSEGMVDFPLLRMLSPRSVLSPFLSIMVLEALSCEFRSGCSQESLYADDLVLIAESMEVLIDKFKKWKEGMETK